MATAGIQYNTPNLRENDGKHQVTLTYFSHTAMRLKWVQRAKSAELGGGSLLDVGNVPYVCYITLAVLHNWDSVGTT